MQQQKATQWIKYRHETSFLEFERLALIMLSPTALQGYFVRGTFGTEEIKRIVILYSPVGPDSPVIHPSNRKRIVTSTTGKILWDLQSFKLHREVGASTIPSFSLIPNHHVFVSN
jgi:hypothetical protein